MYIYTKIAGRYAPILLTHYGGFNFLFLSCLFGGSNKIASPYSDKSLIQEIVLDEKADIFVFLTSFPGFLHFPDLSRRNQSATGDFMKRYP